MKDVDFNETDERSPTFMHDQVLATAALLAKDPE